MKIVFKITNIRQTVPDSAVEHMIHKQLIKRGFRVNPQVLQEPQVCVAQWETWEVELIIATLMRGLHRHRLLNNLTVKALPHGLLIVKGDSNGC